MGGVEAQHAVVGGARGRAGQVAGGPAAGLPGVRWNGAVFSSRGATSRVSQSVAEAPERGVRPGGREKTTACPPRACPVRPGWTWSPGKRAGEQP